MSLYYDLSIILISAFGLWWGALWVVESASRIAKKLGLSELVIGLTVVAFATSAPEFAVTVTAALQGQSAISVGNVVGSNIFNMGIILGLITLFSGVATNRMFFYRDGFLLVGTGLLLLLFFRDHLLELYEGILLFSTLVIYIIVLIRNKEKIEDDEVPEGDFKWSDIPKLIGGVGIIITSANFLVESATSLARIIGISEWVIGITIVAAGTSLPELATSMVALYKGRHGISIGNLIGSDLFNMLGVLGVAAMLKPLAIASDDYFSLFLLAGNLAILLLFIRTRWKITRTEGIILMILALFRWFYDFIF
ncbi:MAG: calcium/sodium antiporter [Ignavibacteria bacterium]|jgi:cation:H+ antiporter